MLIRLRFKQLGHKNCVFGKVGGGFNLKPLVFDEYTFCSIFFKKVKEPNVYMLKCNVDNIIFYFPFLIW